MLSAALRLPWQHQAGGEHQSIGDRSKADEKKSSVTVDIPELGVSLPLDVAVPLDMEVPVDLNVPVTIDQSVPISTTVPISLEVPISIKISDTQLTGYLERLRAALESIEKALSSVGQ